MTAPNRTVATSFRADVELALELFARVLNQIGGQPSSDPDEGPTLAHLEFESGEAVLSVGPSAQADDAAAGLFELSATRLKGVSDEDWQRVVSTVARLPFTRNEIDQITRAMPLTSGLPSMLVGSPLAGLSAIFTIHHMRDFVVMIRAAIGLGLRPSDITVIDKLYRYEVSERVDETLMDLGVHVERYSDMVGALGRHLARTRQEKQRTLILDDGGYVFPALFEHFRRELSDIVGLIEQTTSGIWKLRPYQLDIVPVFSVAESELKATIESYGVTDAVVRNLRRLAPDEMWEGRTALVVGLGKLGDELLTILRDRRMRVSAYDRDILKLLKAQTRGYDTDRDLTRLLRSRQPLVIFGASGGDGCHALTREHFEALERDCYLVSLTSRDFEFDMPALRELSVATKSRGRLGTSYTLPKGPVVTAVADGFPVNFHFAESMPDRYSDLVLASMLVGACTLADPVCDFVAGHNVNKTNQALLASGIVDKYYDLYH